jgi:hypothetical protein
MSRRSALPALTVGVAVAILVAASALAGPPATSSLGVEIQAQDLTGLRPNGTTVIFQVKAVVQGSNVSSLTGEVRQFGSGGAHSYWPATGSIAGSLVTLGGVVADSNAPLLIGSPVKLEADSSTGAMTLTFGPLAGGPFAGQTIVADGFGSVKVKTS